MTLIVALVNPDYAIQLSDRRTTVGDKPDDEEFDKSVLVYTRDGRMVVGFSGLATIPRRFNMREWLTRVLLDSAKPDYEGVGLAERFVERASSDFHSAPFKQIAPTARRTTFHICGFMRRGPYALGSAITVSNWQDFATNSESGEALPEFMCSAWSPSREGSDVAYVRAVGAADMVTDATTAGLKTMLRQSVPPKEVVTCAEQVFQGWAADTRADNLIGKGMDAILMPADFREPVVARNHPHAPSYSHRLPPFVDASSAVGRWAMMGGVMTQVGGSPWTYPSTPRNARCPCGSGLKFKRCHLGQPQAVDWEPFTVFPAEPRWPCDLGTAS